jgi:hypothetical protein
MKSYKSNLNGIIDRLIEDVNLTFNKLLAYYTMYDQGQKSLRETLSQYEEGVIMSPKVGTNLHIEPIPIKDIKQFSDDYPYFISEVFHGKLVGIWNNCLTNIFSLFIDLHFTGKRDFKELKKLDIKLDFNSNENFNSHIKNRIIKAFDFNKEYSERQKLINNILNPNNESNEELDNILKNVLIRNIIQHKNNIVDSYSLKKLGSTQIKILDIAGNSKIYKEDDKILLTIPEIYSFKSSMFYIGQIWRVKDE